MNELKERCDWLSFRWVNELSRVYATRDAQPEATRTHDDLGLMLEVVIDGSLAYGATSNLTPSGIRACFEQTRELARKMSALQLNTFDPQSRPIHQGQYHHLGERPLDKIKVGDILERQISLGKTLKSGPNILSSTLYDNLITTHTLYLTSDGTEIDQKTSIVSRDMRLTGKKGDIIQSRSNHGYMAMSHQVGAEVFHENEQEFQDAQRLVREVNELLDAPDCPTGPLDVVLAPDQMMLQIHESIGHPLEIDRILGDERNYAGWSFINLEDFGSLQYGSPLMNISFDPELKGEIASYRYDDSGVEAKKVYLIKEGKLLAGLGGTESQSRAKVPGVANFRAQSWNRAPIDRMANLNLEPGQSSFDEMIKSVERGIYMETNRSWSIDDYRNKFQFGCEYARLIENGELKGVLKNPNYRGTTVAFWNALKAVGNKDTFEVFGTPHCGKGEPNQVIRVGHASPTCLFSQLSVFGGA